MIGNRFPTEIDGGCSNRLFHAWRALARHRRGDHRRRNHDGFASNLWPWRFAGNIDIDIPLKSKSLNRFATLRAHLIITRSLIHDGRIVVGDIGDIGGLINDGDIAFRRQKH